MKTDGTGPATTPTTRPLAEAVNSSRVVATEVVTATRAVEGSANTATTTSHWQPGQTLQATVISVEGNGKVVLSIGGETQAVELKGPLALVAGQQLRLAVELRGGALALRLLSDATPEQLTITTALRSAMPRQGALTPLFDRVVTWLREGRLAELAPTRANPPTGTSAALPTPPATAVGTVGVTHQDNLTGLLRQLAALLPEAEQLTHPEGLRQALLAAGPFLEPKLAAGDTSQLGNDLKSLLLRLISLLRANPSPGGEAAPRPHANPGQGGGGSTPTTAPPPWSDQELQQLLKEAEGALARIKVGQLHQASAPERQDPTWSAEIPLRHGERSEVLEFKVEQEARRNGTGEEPVWSVRLGYSDPLHGPIAMVLSLTGRHKVGATFWTEQPATAQLFQDQLPLLAERLSSAGFEVMTMAARVGRPPSDQSWVPSPALIDVTA